MVLQVECDVCDAIVPETELVYIERYDNQPAMCHVCVNEHINMLCEQLITWGIPPDPPDLIPERDE